MKKSKRTKTELEELMAKIKPCHLHFVQLYLGSEDGRCFNNATLSYLRAFDIDTTVRKDEKTGKYSQKYLSAKTSAYKLLTTAYIQRLKHLLLLEAGFDTDNIKKRFSELAYQNKNLPLAHASTRDLAKMTGILKDDAKVDIPALTELTESIKKILTP